MTGRSCCIIRHDSSSIRWITVKTACSRSCRQRVLLELPIQVYQDLTLPRRWIEPNVRFRQLDELVKFSSAHRLVHRKVSWLSRIARNADRRFSTLQKCVWPMIEKLRLQAIAATHLRLYGRAIRLCLSTKLKRLACPHTGTNGGGKHRNAATARYSRG